MSQKSVSIVIPCYNEAGNIPLIIKRLAGSFSARGDLPAEVVLVDNGSTDGSFEVMQACINEFKAQDLIRPHRVEVNQGYGHGILSGLAVANGDILAWTHADMQTDPADIAAACELLLAEPDRDVMVKGKRRNRRLLEAFFTFGMQMVAWYALRVRLDDINAQPKVFYRDFYQRHILDKAPTDFSLDLYLLYMARKTGLRILEVPVYFAKRQHGEAKGGGSFRTRIKLIRRTFDYIFALRRSL